MLTKQRIAGMTFLMVGILVLVGCGEKYTPSFAPQVGDKRLVNIQTTTSTSMNVMGQDMSTTQDSGYTLHLEVTEVAVDGVVSLKCVIKEVNMGMNEMVSSSLTMLTGGKLDVKGLEDLISMGVDKEFSMQIAADGNVISTSDLYGISSDIIRDSKLKLGQAKAMVEGMLEQVYGEESMKNTVSSLFEYASKEPVSVGQSWVKQQNITMQQININAENTITLVSNENNQANFQIDGVFSGSGSADSGMPGMDIAMEMEMSGDGTGTAVVDTLSGWPERIEENSTMKMIIGADSIPGMNQDMEQNIKVRYTAKVVPQ